MKKDISLLLILFMVCVCYAQNKKFDKLIKKYDVLQYISNLKKGDAKGFWNAVYTNDEAFQATRQAIDKNKPSAKEAVRELNEAGILSSPYYASLPVSLDSDWLEAADSIKSYLGMTKVFPDFKIYIIESNELNAFTTPKGHVYIADSLILADSTNISGLMGIAAHEATHFILQHSLVRTYFKEKDLSKKKVLFSVAAGVSILANGYAQANGAADERSWDIVNDNNNRLYEEMFDSNIRFKYKFSREQEIQADIVAIRFLKLMGYNPQDYIKVLKYLGNSDASLETDETSTHPSIQFRVSLLEYLINKH